MYRYYSYIIYLGTYYKCTYFKINKYLIQIQRHKRFLSNKFLSKYPITIGAILENDT